MLMSIALILLAGMFMGGLCKRIKLPSLIGMLTMGIVLGPYVLNVIDPKLLDISAELRKIALIIILTRAGLSLDISDLRRIGRPAFMMCFVPATFELLGIVLFGPTLLHISLIEALILGAVLAAVSPAVVVPRMVKLMEEGYGTREGIPQLILAGASVDDVYVIVLFSTFLSVIQGNGASLISFVNIPFSIITGIGIGLGCGYLLARFFERFKTSGMVKVMSLLSVSFILSSLEDMLVSDLSFSSLIAIMFIGVGLQKFYKETVTAISLKYGQLWVGAEIFLFVLVGTTVNIGYLANVGLSVLLLIVVAIIFRMAGVYVCLLGSDLDFRERLFTMMAYTPKATVQAAIGGVPLSMGLACGNVVLTAAVLAIVLTAPLGAFAIDLTYKKFLNKDDRGFVRLQ